MSLRTGYDSELGRFISADSIVPGASRADSFNRYAYVRNNPLKYVDPSGHGVCSGGYNNYTDCYFFDDPARSYSGEQGITTAEVRALEWLAAHDFEAYLDTYPDAPGLLDSLQAIADIAGAAPVIGTPIDVANAAVYLARGRMSDAGIAMAGILPGGELARLIKRSGAAEFALDSRTSFLLDTVRRIAADASASAGPGGGALRGTRIHTEVKNQIRALGYSDLSAEVSYVNTRYADYGTPGSVRVDVLIGSVNSPALVVDIKTAGAYLRSSRVAAIERQLPRIQYGVYEVHVP